MPYCRPSGPRRRIAQLASRTRGLIGFCAPLRCGRHRVLRIMRETRADLKAATLEMRNGLNLRLVVRPSFLPDHPPGSSSRNILPEYPPGISSRNIPEYPGIAPGPGGGAAASSPREVREAGHRPAEGRPVLRPAWHRQNPAGAQTPLKPRSKPVQIPRKSARRPPSPRTLPPGSEMRFRRSRCECSLVLSLLHPQVLPRSPPLVPPPTPA